MLRANRSLEGLANVLEKIWQKQTSGTISRWQLYLTLGPGGFSSKREQRPELAGQPEPSRTSLTAFLPSTDFRDSISFPLLKSRAWSYKCSKEQVQRRKGNDVFTDGLWEKGNTHEFHHRHRLYATAPFNTTLHCHGDPEQFPICLPFFLVEILFLSR